MADTNLIASAKKVHKTICDALNARGWTFENNEENLRAKFTVHGEDLPMTFVFIVDAERELFQLISILPFKFSEDKRFEGAIATCAANYRLVSGCFAYDITNGSVYFKLIESFMNSDIGTGLVDYAISTACVLVDKYNDKFLALNKGFLSLEDFLTQEIEK